MDVKFEPYKGTPGFICMPLVKNIPVAKDPGWKKIECPKCGKECWRRPEMDIVEKCFPLKAVCTECAIRGGLRKESKK
jgi:hypothetical protein